MTKRAPARPPGWHPGADESAKQGVPHLKHPQKTSQLAVALDEAEVCQILSDALRARFGCAVNEFEFSLAFLAVNPAGSSRKRHATLSVTALLGDS